MLIQTLTNSDIPSTQCGCIVYASCGFK